LQDNGGPTETHALLPGSPAIDAGDNTACPATDQRGWARPADGDGDGTAVCDIGAVETQELELSNKAVNASAVLPGTPLTYTITLRNISGANVSNARVTDTLPIALTYVDDSLTATSGSYGYTNRVITWTGSVNAGGAVAITFGAMASQTASGTSVTNSAVISGGGEIITRTATISVASQVEGVAISGPTAGIVQTDYTFIATVSPITATLPITYVWQTTGQSPVMHTNGGLSDIITFTWSTTGTQAITVTATNAGGTVTGTATINVIDGQICNLTKYTGNPVLSVGAGGNWDDDDVWGPAVLKEGGSYKMWYTGDDGSNPSQIGLATSTNGTNWMKEAANPVLSPSETWEANGVMAGSVISDSGLYKMWYTGYDSSGVARIGYATSPDGVTWTKYGSNPVLDVGAAGSWEDEDVSWPTVIKEGGTYHIWYTGYDGMTARIGHATSSNGTSWTKDTANPVLDVGPPGDWDWLDVYGPSVVKVGGEYMLWYSGETLPQAWQTGYALSPNGSDWTRQEMLIPEGASDTFDSNSADYPSVIVDGAGFKVWYSGLNDDYTYSIGYATAEICSEAGTVPPANPIYLPIVMRNFNPRYPCPAYYTDDFSDPDSGWPVDDDTNRRYAYTGGQYQIWVKNPSQGWLVTPGAKATDFTAAVSARRASGSSGGYGIVFGLNEDWSEYYEFDIGPNNYSIWRYDGSWTALRGWTASSAIGTGTSWNRLKVIRNGANITVYVNNQYLTTVTDSSFTGLRRIGLLAYSPSSGSLDARFDDFSLYPASCGADAAGVSFEMGEPGTHGASMPPGLDPSP